MNVAQSFQQSSQTTVKPQRWTQTDLSRLTIRNRSVLFLFLGCMSMLIGVGGLIMFGSEAIQSARCIRETEGQLSPNYRVVTTKRKGTTITEYEVNFSFSVGGKEFYGKDTLSVEPTSRSVAVQFNPDDPTQNQLHSHYNFFENLITLSLCVGGFWLAFFAPTGKKP